MDQTKAQRLVEVGINAYRLGDYAEALEYLKEGLDGCQDDWNGRLYLAMTYYRTGRLALCRHEFKRIMDECMDKELRLKAASALAATNPEVKR